MGPLHICIVGGIFDTPEEHQSKRLFTPETVLVAGLRERGIAVDVCGHRHFNPANDYDIVHVHHLGKAALQMATAGTRSLFVYTSHDPMIASNYRVSRTRASATKFVLNRADAAVTVSTSERRTMGQLFGRYNAPTVVIRYGWPTGVYSYPGPAARQAGLYHLLFVGQLIEQKGVDVLLRALAIVRQTHDADLLLAYHNSSLEVPLRALAAQLGLEDRVEFAGFKSSFELAELYRQVDLFVLPTFAEALPSVVDEAMLSGLPVVASRVAGIPEQVGPHGALVTPGNVEELAGAIARTLDALGAGNLDRRVISEYARGQANPQTLVDKHRHLYEALVRDARKPMRDRRAYWPVNAAMRAIFATYGERLAGRGWLSR